MKITQQKRQRNKDRRERLLAAGLCVTCGHVPSLNGQYCESCKKDHKNTVSSSVKKKILLGLCVNCTEKAIPGKKMCKNHAKQYAKYEQNRKIRHKENLQLAEHIV